MRIKVAHQTHYRYETPVKGVVQILRLTPRNHEGQFVIDWRIEVSRDCHIELQQDAFGNLTHCFAVEGPFSELTVNVEGIVETQDTAGVVRGTIERFPPSLYLRDTDLTEPKAPIREFARTIRAGQTTDLDRLHVLMHAIHEDFAFDTDPTHSATTAAEAFALKRGVCQDLTHVFIAAARAMDIPARYVGGYFHRADGVVQQEAGHAWAEAHVEGLGWVGFDPTNGFCVTDSYIRVAVGLDYLGAAPVRGSRSGGGSEELDVAVLVDQATRQSQS